MLPAKPPTFHLYALVPAEDAPRLPSRRSFSVHTCGSAAALFGPSRPGANAVLSALRHDRIVRLALATCTSVVPFRLGLEIASMAELEALFQLNSTALAGQLARFHDRVEMGLKVRLSPSATGPAPPLPRGLDRIRGLAPDAADRCERLDFSSAAGAPGKTFVASYLISRRAVDDFWRAIEGVRRLAPELPLLGSGPWAAYSFCDVPLKRADPRPLRALESGA
jgi:hypothetical protein